MNNGIKRQRFHRTELRSKREPILLTVIIGVLAAAAARIGADHDSSITEDDIEQINDDIRSELSGDGNDSPVRRARLLDESRVPLKNKAEKSEGVSLHLSKQSLFEFPEATEEAQGTGSFYRFNPDNENEKLLERDSALHEKFSASIERLVIEVERGRIMHVYLPDEDFSLYFELVRTVFEGEEDDVEIIALMRFDDERQDFVGMSLGGAEVSPSILQKGLRQEVQTRLIDYLRR